MAVKHTKGCVGSVSIDKVGVREGREGVSLVSCSRQTTTSVIKAVKLLIKISIVAPTKLEVSGWVRRVGLDHEINNKKIIS